MDDKERERRSFVGNDISLDAMSSIHSPLVQPIRMLPTSCMLLPSFHNVVRPRFSRFKFDRK